MKLLELLTAIAVMWILAALLLPTLNRVTNRVVGKAYLCHLVKNQQIEVYLTDSTEASMMFWATSGIPNYQFTLTSTGVVYEARN